MASQQQEKETKFEVPAGFFLPRGEDLAPPDCTCDSSVVELESRYYDTSEHDLLAGGVTLRRRSGQHDNGWHLKVPAGDARSEIRLPLNESDAVPEELLDLTLGMRRGRDVTPIATVRTTRHLNVIMDRNGSPLVDIADDAVHAAALLDGSASVQQWREIEVELRADSPAADVAYDIVIDRLRREGLRRSKQASKLGRAVGTPSRVVRQAAIERKPRSAGDVLLAYIGQQVDALLSGDLNLRRELDVIHPTRVATRRLRSTLRVFRPFFDAAAVRTFDDDLSWYAGLLGEVRDRQVQRGRLANSLRDLQSDEDDDVTGNASEGIDELLASEQSRAHTELGLAMRSERYVQLIDRAVTWIQDPPFTARAQNARKKLLRSLRKADRLLMRHLTKGTKSGSDQELHKARKAAKRARYAAELLVPVLGKKKAAKRVEGYQHLQDVLGEHQDSATAADLLRRLGAPHSRKAVKNGFTLGVLWARERAHAEDSARRIRRLARHYSS